MPSASTAKKPARSSRPTWSKVQSLPSNEAKGSKSKVQARKPKSQNPKSKIQNPKSKIQNPKSAELPAHIRREMAALVILVVGALAMLGLFTWSRGGQGIIGV